MTDDSDPDSAVVAALAEQVIGLDTVAPEADAGDLAPLWEAFADRRVVGLGEATHGTREFFQLKHRLLRFLVEELGVRLFGLEANFTETLAVDRYVRRGEGDPEAALEGIYFWTWNTEEVLALIEWLRTFNADRPPEDRVRFYGFDAQFTRGAADAVVEYLDRVDPEYLATVHEDLAVLADPGLRPHEADGRDRRLAAADQVVPDLRATLEERRGDYAARSSERAWELARQHATVLEQATEYATAIHAADEPVSEDVLRVRDRAMAENVAWILDHEPTERIALWAHNGHVNRVENRSDGHSAASMGRHLSRRYGDAYYALGFEFGRGAFQALDKAGDEKGGEDDDGVYELREHSLDGPLPDTVAATFAALDRPLAFLDFRTSTADPRLADWLDREHRLHSVGATYDPRRPEEYVESYVLSEAFDGLWYVDETTRARPLDRDCVS